MGVMSRMHLERVLSGGRVHKMQLVDMNVHQFFDREEVLRAIGRKKAKGLSRVGAEVRRQARASMKLAPHGVASPPGRPPHRHRKTKEHRSGGGLWRSVLFAYDPASESVVIGPSTVFGQNIRNVAGRHERGGRVVVRNPRRTRRVLGDGGEVRIGGPQGMGDLSRTDKQTIDLHGNPQWVTYARLTTQPMVDRANRLQEELYGPEIFTADYPQRAFMGPSLVRTQPEIPSILALTWAESIF